MSALCRSRDFHLGIIFSAKTSSSLEIMVSGSLKRKMSTLLILVSITGTSLFRANAIIAAEVPGNFCNSSLVAFQLSTLNSRRLQPSTIFFAHCCNLRALELNPNPDQCLSKSTLDALANDA